MFDYDEDPRSAPTYPTVSEETIVNDSREATGPALRVEQRLFRQLVNTSLGVSSYRLQACSRGRVLN